jgi:hypothetical protein
MGIPIYIDGNGLRVAVAAWPGPAATRGRIRTTFWPLPARAIRNLGFGFA